MALARRKKKGTRKWSARREIKRLDTHCRNIVFERDGHRCRRCQKTKDTAQLHWAHIVSRSKKSVRWHLTNSVVLCYHCHFHWAHENPLAFSEWVKDEIGADFHAALIRKSNQAMPLSPVVVDTWLAYLNDEALRHGVLTI